MGSLREHLKESDIRFVTDCLSNCESESIALLGLLADPDTVDPVLDHPELLSRVLDGVDSLQIGTRLYFYILTRHCLKQAGIDDPGLADYVSGVLEAFSLNSGTNRGQAYSFYLVDWIEQIDRKPNVERFQLYLQIGNQILFVSGFFPEFLVDRSRRRGAPGIEFYDAVGRQFFRSAACHPLGQLTQSERLYSEIADKFTGLRCALNEMSERYVSMERIPDIAGWN